MVVLSGAYYVISSEARKRWLTYLCRFRAVIRNLKPGRYALYINGELVEERVVSGKASEIEIALDVDGKETDVVALQL